MGVRRVGMIAGGSGITPMLQVMRHIFKTVGDTTEVYLLFANQTEEDILLRSELESCLSDNPSTFKKLHYTLDRPPSNWKYSTGFIDEAMLRESMPSPSDDTVILMCGPPPMINYAC